MTVQAAYQELITQISSIYKVQEARNIADWVIEHLTGWKKMDRVVNKSVLLSDLQLKKLGQYSAELLQHRPVQYVLGEAWFAGMRFFVNEDVLIPRPETEELVEWIGSTALTTQPLTTILDIGTGSGCIPVALKKKFPDAEVFACDVSGAALKIACENAKSNGLDINFILCDFLNEIERNKLPEVNVIVSNPPYIPVKDRAMMRENVLSFEPHLALFVSDDEPLIFYEAIADFALTHLSLNGIVYLEIHEDFWEKTADLFMTKGFKQVEIKEDMQGKQRFLKAKR